MSIRQLKLTVTLCFGLDAPDPRRNLAYVILRRPQILLCLLTGLLSAPAAASSLAEFRGFHLGMRMQEAVAVNSSDFRGIIRRQDLYDAEEGTRQLVLRGMGEAITLCFWKDQLYKIKVDLDLGSTEHVQAYLDGLVARHGAFRTTRSDRSSPERLSYVWSDSRCIVRFVRSGQYSLSYEDRNLEQQIQEEREARARGRTSPAESPLDML